MKTKVTTQAIKDLLASMARNPQRKREILESIRQNLSLLEAGCKNEVIEKTVADGAKKHLYIQKEGDKDYERMVVADCLNELDYYNNKQSVLDAAIEKAIDIENKIEQVKALKLVVKKVFQKLDARTQAILEIYNGLIYGDNVVSFNFASELDVFNSESIDILRDEPAFVPLIKAYELVRDINENFD